MTPAATAASDAIDPGDPWDEVVAFARASLIRLDLLDREVPVVLGGGVVRAGDERMMARIAERRA